MTRYTLVALVCVLGWGLAAQAQETLVPPTQMSPAAGSRLAPGTEVQVAWAAQFPACPRNTVGEQELYLSVDGGRTFRYRISPRLLYSDRTFTWRVPDMPTEQAVLDMRFGCEDAPGGCEPTANLESTNPQVASPFSIRRLGRRVEDVMPPTVQAPAQPGEGDVVGLDWQASVGKLAHFEVWYSVDRGGLWTLAGTTTSNHYDWVVPGASGGCRYYFKVVAVKADGIRIESMVDLTQFVAF